MLQSVGTPALWGAFVLFVLVMLAIDLGAFQKDDEAPTPKKAALWSLGWIGLSGLFAGLVGVMFGRDRALEFVTGYLLEKALSVDNIFVFVLVFATFGVPRVLERRVLSLGIIGALILRGAFILGGTALINRFHWLVYGFGILLAVTGVKLLVQKEDEEHDPAKSMPVRVFRRFFPMTEGYRGRQLVVVEAGKRLVTPLLLVLVTIETTDLVFALDSIPAIFGVTTDPFLVFTSNIFAVLGLRSLYFAIASALGKFEHLKTGLALVLLFVAAKILASGYYQVPIVASLAVVGALIGGSMAASAVFPPKRPEERPASETASS